MKLTGRDILEILKTLDALGYRHFRLEHGDLKLEVDVEATRSVPGRDVAHNVAPDGQEPPVSSDEQNPGNDAAPEPKEAHFFPGGNHTDLYDRGAGELVMDFMGRCAARIRAG